MERKAFIQLIVASAAAGSLTALIEACSKSSNTATANFTLDLTQSANNALNSNGGYVVSNNIMVINNSGTYVALSDICTHAGCAISQYSSSSKQLTCLCHGSVFSISGAVVSGPAPSPLQVYTVTKSGNILTIK